MVHSWENHLSFPAFTTKKDYRQLNIFPPCSNFMEDNIPTHAYCPERNYNLFMIRGRRREKREGVIVTKH